MTKVEHLGGDRYRVRIGAGRGLDGKYRQISRTFTATGQRAADRKARQVAAELDRELDAARDRRQTVNGLVDDWLRLPRADSTTYRNRSIVQAIRDGLGHIRLEKLTARDVDLWYASLLTEGRTASTVHHYHRVLHSMLNAAERWDRVPVAVTRKVRPPARNRPKPRPPATDVLADLIADATPGVQLAAILAARLGLRRGEVCGLRWSDLEGDTLTVARSISDVPGKGWAVKAPKTADSARQLTVDAATLAVLTMIRPDEDGWVLADPLDPSKPRLPGWLSQAWQRHCDAHGVKVRFHDLRHWSATNMIGAGVPIPTVTRRLGHAQASTTLTVYAGVLPGSDAEAAAALAALLPAPAPT